MDRGRSSYSNVEENYEATELRLGLPGTDKELDRSTRGCKRIMAATTKEESDRAAETTSDDDDGGPESSSPANKAQVVGWPPIRSHRRNSFQARKTEKGAAEGASPGIYVKVSMDGAPYLRKIDLKMYQSYENLRDALEEMFKCFSLGDLAPAASYAVAYEDKDGDWMLAGDVPWRMFISSCKRLRIMRGSEAKGLGSNS